MSDFSPANLASGRRLARHTAWNLAGALLPLLAAVFAVPMLIHGLGVERFGVLTLVWMVIGYFSLFDLGLGRALIKLVSEKLGAGSIEEIPEIVWTALLLMLLLGIAGALALLALTDWLAADVLKIPPSLQNETADAFRLLAWSVPVVILTTGLRGVLEAYQRFDLVNLVRMPMGVLTFVGPLAVLPFSNRLDAVVLVLLGLRIAFCAVHAALCARVVPALLHRAALARRHVRPMLGFGGWMTVSNVVGPLMVYLDRFVIGSVLGMASVAYYVASYEVITKLLVFSGALAGVLFPAFAASLAGDRSQAAGLFGRGVRWVFLAMFPLVLVATVFASDGLRLWLSVEFARNGTAVLQWLAAGILLSSLANIPFTFIQAAGRPDLAAKLHFAELPFYLLGLWLCMNQWGLAGVAFAWTLRAGLDAAALFVMAAWLEKSLWRMLKRDALILALALAVLALGTLLASAAVQIAFASVVLTGFAFLAWHYLLTPEERVFVHGGLPRRSGTNTP